MSLQESGEMYLETILVLRDEMRIVRSIDVAERMDFSKASVSRAIKILKNDGYIEVERTGNLVLTESGEAIAKKIYERHNVLTAYLKSIGVNAKTAEDDACRIEHVISDESFAAIKKMVK